MVIQSLKFEEVKADGVNRLTTSAGWRRWEACLAVLLEAQELPVAAVHQAGLAGERGNAVIGMPGRAKLPADCAGLGIFDDGVDDPGAAGGGVGPGKRLAVELAEVRRRDGVSDGRLVRYLGGRSRRGNRSCRQAVVHLRAAKKIHGHAAGQREKSKPGNSRKRALF